MVEKRFLGKTGLQVSRLCFGSLTIGPLQRALSVEAGGALIRQALQAGVNFIDTAELYDNYAHIRSALQDWPEPVVVATKSYAYTSDGMEVSLEKARRELNVDQIGIFMLHEQESSHTLRGHWPALERLLEAKKAGIVKAVGISTHYVAAVRAAAALPEIDVISPLINRRGLGIQDGSCQEMLEAIGVAHGHGKGIYAMKPLGGGHLIDQWQTAIQFLLDRPEIDSIAVGMKSFQELMANIDLVSGLPVDEGPVSCERRLHIDDWCVGCGRCVRACPNRALKIEADRAQVDAERCVFCGYCGAACPEFAIKVI